MACGRKNLPSLETFCEEITIVITKGEGHACKLLSLCSNNKFYGQYNLELC